MSNRTENKAAAVFLDRDGTIIEDTGFVGRPEDVHLLPGAAEGIRRLNRAALPVVVVSNQSGIARGLLSEEDLSRVHARVEALLAAEDARLDGAYYCPFLSGEEAVVATYRKDSELRKPAPGMLLAAAEELGIDLARSWMIGDQPRDVEAGRRAGCRTIRIVRDDSAAEASENGAVMVARDLGEAARIVEQAMTEDADLDLTKPEDQGVESDRAVDALERIYEVLDRAHREERQHDFSFLRLSGALLQMFAIVAALWGVFPLLEGSYPAATARLALACFLQLAAISAFAIDRFR